MGSPTGLALLLDAARLTCKREHADDRYLQQQSFSDVIMMPLSVMGFRDGLLSAFGGQLRQRASSISVPSLLNFPIYEPMRTKVGGL